MSYIDITYALYLVLTLGLTIWVASTLKKNGRAFLIQTFKDDTDLADSINHLLVIGFYLVNIGYLALALTHSGEVNSTRVMLEVLSQKVGTVSIILGFMHFFNLFVFTCFIKKPKKPQPSESLYNPEKGTNSEPK